MQHRRLREAGQRLVRALDHHVGPRVHGALGQVRMEVKVRPVRFVDQNPAARGMRLLHIVVNIGTDAEVVGIGEKNRLCLRVVPQDARKRLLGGKGLELQQTILLGFQVDRP